MKHLILPLPLSLLVASIAGAGCIFEQPEPEPNRRCTFWNPCADRRAPQGQADFDGDLPPTVALGGSIPTDVATRHPAIASRPLATVALGPASDDYQRRASPDDGTPDVAFLLDPATPQLAQLRLADATGTRLIDSSTELGAGSAPEVALAWWDELTLPTTVGTFPIELTAGSFSLQALVTMVDDLDAITVSHQPDGRVCAHAMKDGREVIARWTLDVGDEVVADYLGNCVAADLEVTMSAGGHAITLPLDR